jgi:hypothetical protein
MGEGEEAPMIFQPFELVKPMDKRASHENQGTNLASFNFEAVAF